MKKFYKPNFKRCNINVSSTLAEFLGAPNSNATLPRLKKELQKGYKNVVFICFDGMGMYPLKRNLGKNDYLRRHVFEVLSSTFPSTTTNATTSLTTNRLPLEHGWFGWSMNFENIGRNVNIFLNTDSWTNEPIATDNPPIEKFPYYFDTANTDYQINTVFPPFVNVEHPERNTVWDFVQEHFFDAIKSICEKDGKQFVYAYNNEPDHSMHEWGVTCAETKTLMQTISSLTKKLAEQTRDTLFIITADHGQIDVEGYAEMYSDEKLLDMLRIYPYMEARAVAFPVKEDKKAEFEKYFTLTYGKDFELHKSADLIAQGYFGSVGDKARLLGDYIAIGTRTHKIALLTPDAMRFKGHHTSLTEEMLVPLILIKN